MNTTIYKDTTEFVSDWQYRENFWKCVNIFVRTPPIEIGGYNLGHPYGIQRNHPATSWHPSRGEPMLVRSIVET